MRPINPAVSAFIQGLIDEIAPHVFGDWPMRVCKEQYNAVPIHGNWMYLWALRPDGTVLCMDHETFGHPVTPEDDPLAIYAVLVHAAKRYPILQELVPEW